TYAALRTGVYRLAHDGPLGLVERPRAGRPRQVTCELEQHLHRLVDQDPLPHGSVYAPWSGRELATVFAHQTGVQLGRASVRGVFNKTPCPPAALPAAWIPSRPPSPMARSTSLRWHTAHAGARSFCSTKMQQACGAVRCPERAGGAPRSARA